MTVRQSLAVACCFTSCIVYHEGAGVGATVGVTTGTWVSVGVVGTGCAGIELVDQHPARIKSENIVMTNTNCFII